MISQEMRDMPDGELDLLTRALQLVQATKKVMDAAEEVCDAKEADRPIGRRLEALADAVGELRTARSLAIS